MSHSIFKVRKISLECLGIMYFWNMRQSIEPERYSSLEMFINFTLDVHAHVRKVC